MKKPTTHFLAGVFTALGIYGGLWMLGFLLEQTFDSGFKGHDISVVSTTIAPDQSYIATIYSDMGGGAAGWCYKGVDVRKTDQPFEDGKHRVFSTGCGTDVVVRWQSDKYLQVNYSPDRESISLFQKFWSEDKAVRIYYATK